MSEGKHRRRILGWFLLILVGAGLLCLGIRIYHVNRDYSSQQTGDTIAGMGETLTYDGKEYTIDEAWLYDYAAFVQAYPELPYVGYLFGGQFYTLQEDRDGIRILVYSLQVKIGEEGDGEDGSFVGTVIPASCGTQNGSVNTGYNVDYLKALNPDADFDYHRNSVVRLMIPVTLYKSNFSESDWENLASLLQVSVAYNPHYYGIQLNHVKQVTADAAAEEMLAELLEQQEILNLNKESERIPVEQNVMEGSRGSFHSLYYTIEEVERLDLEELAPYCQSDDWTGFDWDTLNSHDGYYISYKVIMNITNQSDREQAITIGNLSLTATEKGDSALVGYTELDYIEESSIEDVSIYEYDILLEPEQSKQIEVIFGGFIREETESVWLNGDLYLCVNPAGEFVDHLDQKLVGFIRIEDDVILAR